MAVSPNGAVLRVVLFGLSFIYFFTACHVGMCTGVVLFLRPHVWPRGLISSHPALARRGRDNVAPTLRDQFPPRPARTRTWLRRRLLCIKCDYADRQDVRRL